VVARDLVVHIAEDALDRIGPWAVSRKPEQMETRLRGEPALHGSRLVDFVVIDGHIDAVVGTSGIAACQRLEQIPKELVGFARSAAVVYRSSPAIPGSGPVVLLVFAGREHFDLRASRHPWIAALGQ
jgi:hypothetical protein